MSVLVVALGIYSREGGMERFNRRLIGSLAELGESGAVRDTTVISLWDTPLHATHAPAGVRFVPGQRSKVRVLISFLTLLFRLRFDTILYGHVLLTPLMVFGRLFARRSRHILLVHGVEVWAAPGLFRRWVVRGFADGIVAVSEFTAKRMRAVYRLPAGMFSILPNALDVDEEAGYQAGPDLRLPGEWRLLSVSRLTPNDVYKNVDKVILAMPSILATFPETHYYVVGDGAWRPALESLARSAGVATRVHFLGRVDDATRDAIYSQTDLFVLPSSKEGFGIVFLEAWRCRLAIVAGNQDAATEVIRDGVDGLCVDPRSGRIASAVCDLLADGARRTSMGEEGHRRLREHFNHDRFRLTVAEILSRQRSCAV